jgi:hypothetical protein
MGWKAKAVGLKAALLNNNKIHNILIIDNHLLIKAKLTHGPRKPRYSVGSERRSNRDNGSPRQDNSQNNIEIRTI